MTHSITRHDTYINALLCGDAEMLTAEWVSGDFSAKEGLTLPEKLVPTGDISKVFAAKQVILKRIMFNVYDASLSPEGDDTSIFAKIRQSLDEPNDAYVQTRFRGAAMFDFQPNWHTPKVEVNGIDLFSNMAKSSPFGAPIPFGFEPFKPLGEVHTLNVYSRCAQAVDGGHVMYPCLCWMELLLIYKDNI